MRQFSHDILAPLNKECNCEPIHFIGLGTIDFQVSFATIDRILTREKAVFSISGEYYSWEEGPTNIPVWLLIGQTPTNFDLPTPLSLRMNLASGDYVEFHTAEGPYESVIIDFGKKGDSLVWEIY